jgi:FKBP-type peptidyl-prolyl cis-trans isomerase SlyD
MKIANKHVVGIEYVLKDNKGEVLDSNEGGEPLLYIHGLGQIVMGLEKALEGRGTGDKVEVSVKAEDGYGDFDKDLIQRIPRTEFKDMEPLEEGMEIVVETEEGEDQIMSISELSEKEVTLDGNHPLAGQDLHFQVTISSVREATAEEIDHGHAHGAGGHHHH